ncbi:MAG: hypothetical protein FD128_1584, partial [Hyphomonadaceae bacterium]
MSTLVELIKKGTLVKYEPLLADFETEERIIYMIGSAKKYFDMT